VIPMRGCALHVSGRCDGKQRPERAIADLSENLGWLGQLKPRRFHVRPFGAIFVRLQTMTDHAEHSLDRSWPKVSGSLPTLDPSKRPIRYAREGQGALTAAVRKTAP